jgi:hypothetical protein
MLVLETQSENRDGASLTSVTDPCPDSICYSEAVIGQSTGGSGHLVRRYDAPEVLQSVQGNESSKLLELSLKVKRVLPVAAVRNDRFGSTLMELVAQLVAII